MERDVWLILPFSPEPWRVGPLSVGRTQQGKWYARIGRDQQLHDYQETIRQTIKQKYENLEMFSGIELAVEFYFWQKLERYTTESGRRSKRHVADCTNMVKAAEDALQGVVYKNDSVIRQQFNVILDRSEETPGLVVIRVRPWESAYSEASPMLNIPDNLYIEIIDTLFLRKENSPVENPLFDD